MLNNIKELMVQRNIGVVKSTIKDSLLIHHIERMAGSRPLRTLKSTLLSSGLFSKVTDLVSWVQYFFFFVYLSLGS